LSIAASTALLRWQSTGITVAGVVGVAGSGENQLNSPFGLVVDPFDTLYIADSDNNRIQKLMKGASSGTTSAGQANGTQGNSMYSLYSPGGVAFDSNSNIYVADAYNQRVQFWANSASSGTTVAGITGKGLHKSNDRKQSKYKVLQTRSYKISDIRGGGGK
jgi:hypothetical protein